MYEIAFSLLYSLNEWCISCCNKI